MLSGRLKQGLRVTAVIMILFVLPIFFMPLSSYADDKYWFGGTGSWDDSSNWNPYGVPTDDWGEHVYVTNAPDTNATVFVTDGGSSGLLEIYGTDEETMTLFLSGGSLFVGHIDIKNGGILHQTGGSFQSGMAATIHLGGTYNLEDGLFGSSMNFLSVGGVFNQTGGIVGGIGNLDDISVSGTYNLSGTGVIRTDNSMYIWSGGVFNQNGGTFVSGGGRMHH